MKTKRFKAFTLVELIVVITILAILWTIAFISLQWYSANARDSVRISNLTNMDKGLAFLQAKDWTLPDPAWNTTTITLSGSTIMIQWEILQSMAEKHLKMSWDIVDPVDSTNPIYSLSTDKKKYQIAMFLEAENLAYTVNKVHAADWKTFITKWNKLWIVLSDEETPVNQQTWALETLELTTTTANHKVYLDDTEVVEWQWSELSAINPVASCKRILETGWSRSANWWNWVYTINPAWADIQVYCDMTTDWGGWTKLMHIADGASSDFHFTSTHWDTNSLLNQNIFSWTVSSKYSTYNIMSWDHFLVRVWDMSFQLDANEKTALQKVTWDIFDKQWDTGYSSCNARDLSVAQWYVENMQLQWRHIWKGINLWSTTSNSARFGWIADNSQSDSVMWATSDSAFGLWIRANGRNLWSGRLTWGNSGCSITNYLSSTTWFAWQLFIR